MEKIVIESFSIELHKTPPIYIAGETLVGTVNIKVKEKLKINGVNLLMIGAARVHWEEPIENDFDNSLENEDEAENTPKMLTYSTYEEYLKNKIALVPKVPNKDLFLTVGEHLLKFEFPLPANLPTSFEHDYGRVRYSLFANIDNASGTSKNVIKSFTVINLVDLNMNPLLRAAYGTSDTKFIRWGPCLMDPISANFDIIKGGFVPGEPIQFNVCVNNRSTREIQGMTISLVQNIRFYASRPKTKVKNSNRNIISINYPKKIAARAITNWNDKLVIPPVVPSSSITFKSIDISYKLVLFFDTSGLPISTDMPIPIVIGTLPLLDNDTVNQPFPAFEKCPFERTEVSFGIPLDFEIKGDITTSDANEFNPYYPYFNYIKMESKLRDIDNDYFDNEEIPINENENK